MTDMFDTLLIANRGEIACRVIRTARAMGIRTVAVYSDADRDARHVRLADTAVGIGPGPARESYLDIGKIIAACKATGAQAVHPGYGFLSENADFARALREAGLVFVGPPPEAIDALGNKSAAKRLAERIGVPCLPGYSGAEQDLDTLVAHAQRIGPPLMIKAAAGGGGRGMRRCDDVTDVAALRGLLEAARSARSATATCCWSAWWNRPGTWKCRCSATTTATTSTWASATAPRSGATRRCWKKRLHRASRPRCARRWARPPSGWRRRSATAAPAPSSS
jgi:acetyl/propionyl-CoA carboxylase alpha subunit